MLRQQATMPVAVFIMGVIKESFEERFGILHQRSADLIGQTSSEMLYRKPREIATFSCGEYILRSAASVEQTCGGLTTRLWDDPFEWTLPEKLSDPKKVLEYLDEVEKARENCFSFFTSDEDLMKQVPTPGDLKPIFHLLLETLGRAEHFQGRAFAVFQMHSNEKLPRR